MGCMYFETLVNILPQISSDAKYFFLSCSRHFDRKWIVVIVNYVQIWNKKEHIIISSY